MSGQKVLTLITGNAKKLEEVGICYGSCYSAC